MRIELKNYKRFTDLRTQIADEPGGWTFIHGWPNSGKTTLLEAIALILAPRLARDTLIGACLLPPLGEAEICTKGRQIVLRDHWYTLLGKEPLIQFISLYGAMRVYNKGHQARFDQTAAWNVSGYSALYTELLVPTSPLQYLAIDYHRTNDQWWPVLKDLLTGLACASVDFDDKARLCVDGVPFYRHGSAIQDLTGLFVDIIASWRQYTGADAKPDLSQIQGTVLIDRIDLHLNQRHLREIMLVLQREMPKLNFIVTMDRDNFMINWIRRQDVSIPL